MPVPGTSTESQYRAIASTLALNNDDENTTAFPTSTSIVSGTGYQYCSPVPEPWQGQAGLKHHADSRLADRVMAGQYARVVLVPGTDLGLRDDRRI
jgi:hypothetical protein